MPSVTFRLSPTLHERFLKHLEDKDIKASDFLREAVERFLDRVDDAPFTAKPSTQPGHDRSRVWEIKGLSAPTVARVRGFSALGGEPLPQSQGPLELAPKRGKK